MDMVFLNIYRTCLWDLISPMPHVIGPSRELTTMRVVRHHEITHRSNDEVGHDDDEGNDDGDDHNNYHGNGDDDSSSAHSTP